VPAWSRLYPLLMQESMAQEKIFLAATDPYAKPPTPTRVEFWPFLFPSGRPRPVWISRHDLGLLRRVFRQAPIGRGEHPPCGRPRDLADGRARQLWTSLFAARADDAGKTW
jgi:hypothetical protein